MTAARSYGRVRIDGTPITNVIQDDKCFDCGMGLCDPREWHPYVACEVFRRTHDSRKVWSALRDLAETGGAPWLT